MHSKNYRAKKFISTITLGFTLGLTLTFYNVIAQDIENIDSSESHMFSRSNEIPQEQIENFVNVINSIKTHYVEPVDDKELFENAIRGMLAGLDPHSSFLDKSDFEDLKTVTSGKFGGLGIEVTMEDGFVKVIAPIDDTPASKSGIKAGDLIVKIDKTPVKGLTLKQAVDIMRGKPGSEIKLMIVRQGETAPLEFNVIRDVIKIVSVKNELIDDHYGYIRISQFQSTTADNVMVAFKKLKEIAKDKKLNGLVLDLRNNPGGILTGAINVSDIFLDHLKLDDNSIIVSTKGRIKDIQSSAYSRTEDLTGGIPVVVLVNNGSASASEIVAGALQDHNRAIIMGTPTFGKGSVQTVLPLKSDQGLKLTTALYYTPSGKSIQATGIIPDVIVEDLKVKPTELPITLMTSEADLKDHLANGNHDNVNDTNQKPENKTNLLPASDDKQGDNKQDKKKESLAEKDYQLNEAINLLKGLRVLGKS